MICIRRDISTPWPLLAAAGLAAATPAFPQAPSDPERAAIKSNCRSDYMAPRSSVPPAGAASLQCPQQNMASLSGACASALKAVSAPAETKAEPQGCAKGSDAARLKAPNPLRSPLAMTSTKTPTKPAATIPTTTAAEPRSAQIAAIRSNCRSEYPQVCAGVPTGGAAALQCLQKNKSKLSQAREKVVAAASGGAAAPAAGNPAPAAANASSAAVPSGLVLRPMLPRAPPAAQMRARSAAMSRPAANHRMSRHTTGAAVPGLPRPAGQFAAQ